LNATFFTETPQRKTAFDIWVFHGGHCEEFRLLGSKNPGRTSQETLRLRYSPRQWTLCKSWGLHDGDYEEFCLLGYRNLKGNILRLVYRAQVFAAVAMKNAVFWDVTLCCYSKNRRFGGTHRLLHQDDKSRRAKNVRNN
jgi:hypothetical protein